MPGQREILMLINVQKTYFQKIFVFKIRLELNFTLTIKYTFKNVLNERYENFG